MANKNGQKGKIWIYFQILKLADLWCSFVLPEGQVVFCFSASQRKAKKFLSVLCGSSERMQAGGEFVSKCQCTH
jgi:hypothetical protein